MEKKLKKEKNEEIANKKIKDEQRDGGDRT